MLVLASQCEQEAELVGLEDVARDLHSLLRDPELGVCEPALPDGDDLVVCDRNNPRPAADLTDLVRRAYDAAGDQRATLVLDVLGHGWSTRSAEKLYFMAWSSKRDAPGSGVEITGLLEEAVGRKGVDGVVALVDLCSAAAAAPSKSALVNGLVEGGTRLAALFAAGAGKDAYGLSFSRELAALLRTGLEGQGGR